MRTIFAKTFSVLFAALACPLLSFEVFAQPLTPQLPTPPPMRFIARDDKSQLTTTRDAKARVKLTIELAHARLVHMEALTSQKDFEKASEVLGHLSGVVEDAMRFIGVHATRENQHARSLPRLDIALRAQSPGWQSCAAKRRRNTRSPENREEFARTRALRRWSLST